MNKKYIIAAMATSFALNMNAQSVKVTGNVVDSNNEPVIGAYIKVKGSNRGAVTDLDGHYTIDADNDYPCYLIRRYGKPGRKGWQPFTDQLCAEGRCQRLERGSCHRLWSGKEGRPRQVLSQPSRATSWKSSLPVT